MRRYVVGVVVERVQRDEILVLVEASSEVQANEKACAEVRTKTQDELREATSKHNWQDVSDGIEVIGTSGTEYPDGFFDADIDLTGDRQ